jgi:hypothetical protein
MPGGEGEAWIPSTAKKKKKKIHETKVGLVICFKLSFKKKLSSSF